MATSGMLQEEIRNGSDIVGLVSKEPTWKELLIELVDRNKLDPWNIDIIEIVDSYMEAIRNIKSIDLKVPANVVLAASVLLRLKSSLLVIGAPEPEPEEPAYAGIESIVVEPLSFRSRLPPKRRVSLDELISALDEAMRIKEQRTAVLAFRRPPLSFEIISPNIEANATFIYDFIKKNSDSEKVALFSDLVKGGDFDSIMLELFIPMLYLASGGRIRLRQDRFFGEIFITLN